MGFNRQTYQFTLFCVQQNLAKLEHSLKEKMVDPNNSYKEMVSTNFYYSRVTLCDVIKRALIYTTPDTITTDDSGIVKAVWLDTPLYKSISIIPNSGQDIHIQYENFDGTKRSITVILNQISRELLNI